MITEKQLKEWDAIWKRIVEGAVPALIDEVIRLGRMATYYETAVLDAKQRRESKYGGYTMDEIVAEGKPFAVSSTHSELITDLAMDIVRLNDALMDAEVEVLRLKRRKR